MDYTNKTLKELVNICKTHNIKGYSGKKKEDILALLEKNLVQNANVCVPEPTTAETTTKDDATKDADTKDADTKDDTTKDDTTKDADTKDETKPPIRQDIIHGDTIQILPTLETESAQIIIADPPYNIGKDFGNQSDKQPIDEYLSWCDNWIRECLRILKPNGTMFVYGFSETLALILARVPYHINRRWLIWHYTNKNVPSLNFWQRSHESILVLWKNDKVFHRDDIREPYTEGFLKGAAGKERKATKGRFSNGDTTTTYNAHANGALPRDVIKIPALAGGAGAKERVDHPTQKPLGLCDTILLSCRQSDGYVLVPFAGSGSECVSAKKMNLPFVGIELNEEYIKLIHTRLCEQTQ